MQSMETVIAKLMTPAPMKSVTRDNNSQATRRCEGLALNLSRQVLNIKVHHLTAAPITSALDVAHAHETIASVLVDIIRHLLIREHHVGTTPSSSVMEVAIAHASFS